MNDAKWERYGALAGVLFVVLTVASGMLTGSPPDLDAPAGEVVKWVAEHDAEVRISCFLGVLAVFPALWWLGSLWRALRRAEGGQPRLTVAAVLGLLFAGGLVTVASILSSALSLRFRDLDPGTVRFVYLASQMLFYGAGIGIAALVGAISVVTLRSGAFPRWHGIVGALLAVAWLVSSFGMTSDKDGFLALGFVCFLIWMLWTLVLSVLMYQRVPDSTT